ncbi:MAG TPA: chromate transporter [Anaerolineales bacterium]|nr:chromate transporter [Anaerolineales bacterium]
MGILLSLFWLFLKVNLLSTSGISSVGLLHQEAVGKIITEEQFAQAVSFSSVLPGSEAEKLAMFVGLRVAGMPGALISLLGSSLPPIILMLGVFMILRRLQRETWVTRFVEGLIPAVAVLMLYAAYGLLTGGTGPVNWRVLTVAAVSLIAFIFDAPPPLVLIAAGLVGIFFFK